MLQEFPQEQIKRLSNQMFYGNYAKLITTIAEWRSKNEIIQS